MLSARTGSVVRHVNDTVALARQFATVERTDSHCHLHRRHDDVTSGHVTWRRRSQSTVNNNRSDQHHQQLYYRLIFGTHLYLAPRPLLRVTPSEFHSKIFCGKLEWWDHQAMKMFDGTLFLSVYRNNHQKFYCGLSNRHHTRTTKSWQWRDQSQYSERISGRERLLVDAGRSTTTMLNQCLRAIDSKSEVRRPGRLGCQW